MIRIALIHSSTVSHADIVETLLNHGIPVFVDKPLSYHIEDCEWLLELASGRSQPLYRQF